MKIESFKKKETKEPKGVTVTSKNVGKMIEKAKVALEDNKKRNMNQPPVVINLPKKKETENTVNTELKQKVDKRKSLPHLFKKGQSGNPNGRPLGSGNFTTALKNEAKAVKSFIEKETGKKIEIDVNTLIAQALLKKSIAGDVRAIEYYGNRVDGKPTEAVKIEGEITQRLIILPAKKGKE